MPSGFVDATGRDAPLRHVASKGRGAPAATRETTSGEHLSLATVHNMSTVLDQLARAPATVLGARTSDLPVAELSDKDRPPAPVVPGGLDREVGAEELAAIRRALRGRAVDDLEARRRLAPHTLPRSLDRGDHLGELPRVGGRPCIRHDRRVSLGDAAQRLKLGYELASEHKRVVMAATHRERLVALPCPLSTESNHGHLVSLSDTV